MNSLKQPMTTPYLHMNGPINSQDGGGSQGALPFTAETFPLGSRKGRSFLQVMHPLVTAPLGSNGYSQYISQTGSPR